MAVSTWLKTFLLIICAGSVLYWFAVYLQGSQIHRTVEMVKNWGGSSKQEERPEPRHLDKKFTVSSGENHTQDKHGDGHPQETVDTSHGSENNTDINTKSPNPMPPREANLKQLSTRRYLLSVHFDSNGPNVQYQTFRKAVAYAMQTNRSIVEQYFWVHSINQEPNHPRQHYLNDTFDLNKLREIVDIATIEEFNRDCNHSLDIMLLDPEKNGGYPDAVQYQKKIDYYRKTYHISLPELKDLPKTTNDRVKAIETSASLKCVGVNEPMFWTRKTPSPLDTERKIDVVRTHLIVHPRLRNTAQKISAKICDGKIYAAMHWRNKSAEGCAPPRHCDGDGIRRVIAVNKTAQLASKDIRNFMKANNVTCIYVALPGYAKLMINIMKDANIPNVISTVDITPPKYPDVEKYKHDNYFWSLLEQEICIRSHVYISNVHSSWDIIVSNARSAQNAKTVKMTDVISWIAEGAVVR